MVPPPAVAGGIGVLLLGLVVLYFAPTLLAIARGRGAAPATFSVNLLIGWTGVGWVAAWLLAVADHRLHIYVQGPTTPATVVPTWPVQHPSVTVAPDGRRWWDGSEWKDGSREAPRDALWAPDGTHWFTGSYWIPGIAPGTADDVSDRGSSADEPDWWRR